MKKKIKKQPKSYDSSGCLIILIIACVAAFYWDDLKEDDPVVVETKPVEKVVKKTPVKQPPVKEEVKLPKHKVYENDVYPPVDRLTLRVTIYKVLNTEELMLLSKHLINKYGSHEQDSIFYYRDTTDKGSAADATYHSTEKPKIRLNFKSNDEWAELDKKSMKLKYKADEIKMIGIWWRLISKKYPEQVRIFTHGDDYYSETEKHNGQTYQRKLKRIGRSTLICEDTDIRYFIDENYKLVDLPIEVDDPKWKKFSNEPNCTYNLDDDKFRETIDSFSSSFKKSK